MSHSHNSSYSCRVSQASWTTKQTRGPRVKDAEDEADGDPAKHAYRLLVGVLDGVVDDSGRNRSALLAVAVPSLPAHLYVHANSRESLALITAARYLFLDALDATAAAAAPHLRDHLDTSGDAQRTHPMITDAEAFARLVASARDDKWLAQLLAATQLEQLVRQDLEAVGALSIDAIRNEHTSAWHKASTDY